MKRSLLLVLISVSLTAFLISGCKSQESSDGGLPPLDSGRSAIGVEVSYDEFMNQQHVAKEVQITYPGSLLVTLGSNPTTGFQWPENAKISEGTVLEQVEHSFIPSAAAGVVGAAGKDVWTFRSLKKGTSAIYFEYGRPWEGGEKAAWTITLTVVVE